MINDQYTPVEDSIIPRSYVASVKTMAFCKVEGASLKNLAFRYALDGSSKNKQYITALWNLGNCFEQAAHDIEIAQRYGKAPGFGPVPF